MTDQSSAPAEDNRLGAARSLAWVILLNKPFYPLYMLWLAPNAFGPAWLTAMSAPVYAAAIWLMKTRPMLARLLIFGAGTVDTVIAAKAFGAEAGAEWFFVPIALLVPVMFAQQEETVRKRLVLALLVTVLACLPGLGVPITVLSSTEATSLFWMNFYAVVCLTLFILWRFQVVRLPSWR
ncbi:MAG: hypothetical protein ACKVON_06305 [Beijerinckiaceae bacterium]